MKVRMASVLHGIISEMRRTMEKNGTKKHRRNELILVGVIAVLAVLYFLWRALYPAKEGATVVVQVYGEEYARLPLDKDTELDITHGENHNHLVIKDGVATVTDASCPDKICVNQSDISKSTDMIVCLPNQVLITIEGGEESGTDSIVR